MSSFRNIEFDNQIHDYLILQQCLNKKDYSKSVCNIIFKYFTDISYQEVDNNHKKNQRNIGYPRKVGQN